MTMNLGYLLKAFIFVAIGFLSSPSDLWAQSKANKPAPAPSATATPPKSRCECGLKYQNKDWDEKVLGFGEERVCRDKCFQRIRPVCSEKGFQYGRYRVYVGKTDVMTNQEILNCSK